MKEMKKEIASKRPQQLLVLVLVLVLIGLFFFYDVSSYLKLSQLKEHRDILQTWVNESPWIASLIFFSIYFAVASLSLPGASLLTLAAGALFPLWLALGAVSLASTAGATAACGLARWFLRDSIQRRFHLELQEIQKKLAEEGPYYLFALRLNPLVPFFIVNSAFGLTSLPLRQFAWVSWLGMLPGTWLYVSAGKRLGELQSLQEILEPGTISLLILLGIFPLLARFFLKWIERKKALRKFKKPKSFDYDLIVIGGGAAGLVSSYMGSTLQARVLLFEKDKMGGECLNTGCVPSKSLLNLARQRHESLQWLKRCAPQALPPETFESVLDRNLEWTKIQETLRSRISAIAPKDSRSRYESLGVDVKQSRCKVLSPWQVESEGNIYSAQKIVIATGSSPRVLHWPSEQKFLSSGGHILTNESIWSMKSLPKNLVIVGGGPMGCEMAQAFQRLGSQVHLIESHNVLLPQVQNHRASQVLLQQLQSEGVRVELGQQMEDLQADRVILRKTPTSRQSPHVPQSPQDEIHQRNEVFFGEGNFAVLQALGRIPRVKGFGLEELQVRTDSFGRLTVDSNLETSVPGIYACGDVCSAKSLTNVASYQAVIATLNSLFHPFFKMRSRLENVPTAVFTSPEVAITGHDLADLVPESYEVISFDLYDLDRSITEGLSVGFLEIYIDRNSHKILRACVVHSRATEILGEIHWTMTRGLKVESLLSTPHIYPSFSEASKLAVGEWRKKKTPEWQLKLLRNFHNFRRRRFFL